MRAREGDGQDGECLPQVFQTVDGRQGLLDVGRAHSFAQAGCGLPSECMVLRCQFPHLVPDQMFSFLGQHRGDPAHVPDAHSDGAVPSLDPSSSMPDLTQ